MYTRKKSKTKLYLAIILIVLISLTAVLVAIYVNGNAPVVRPVAVGVKAGDSFTYSIKGQALLINSTATIPNYFYQYNQTDYYKITITNVQGTVVSMNTQWKFLNGTELVSPQTIDLSTGNKTDNNGFWSLYAANLNVGDLLRPNGYDGQTVNKTDTKTYADSTRTRNYWFIGNEFFDVTDPTHNSRRYEYNEVYFDKQTGMVDTLVNLQSYNQPEKELVMTWRLTETNVWNVK
jgi:hypothetical protein